jgi:hypothetical protein
MTDMFLYVIAHYLHHNTARCSQYWRRGGCSHAYMLRASTGGDMNNTGILHTT